MKTLALILVLAAPAASPTAAESGFRALFNGKDLSGWIPVNTAPSTWSVRDEMLICSGKPIGELRTTRMYQNFILELEWRHRNPGGNAGIFVWADDITAPGVPFHRGIEVQILDHAFGNTPRYTTHGDIFPIHGATMTPINGRGGERAFPTELRSRPTPEWNHYRIDCRNGEISLAVNGKVVTRGQACSPRKGYICIESEGGIVHYRNVRIRELPDTPVDPEHVAIADRGFRSLYRGVDLTGWKSTGKGWKANDWVLSHGAQGKATLTTTEAFGDVGFVWDVRLSARSRNTVVSLRGAEIRIDKTVPGIGQHLKGENQWNRFEGKLRGERLSLSLNGKPVFTERSVATATSGPLELHASGPVDFANVYVRALTGAKK